MLSYRVSYRISSWLVDRFVCDLICDLVYSLVHDRSAANRIAHHHIGSNWLIRHMGYQGGGGEGGGVQGGRSPLGEAASVVHGPARSTSQEHQPPHCPSHLRRVRARA